MTKVLSKSRYKLGLECANKLFFHSDKSFKNQQTDNSFLASLAEGGFQVEALARLKYPQGFFVKANPGDYQAAARESKLLFDRHKVVVYEAAFLTNDLYAMTDIVVKNGNDIKLIEVKAKSYDPNDPHCFIGKRGGLVSSWKPYLFDLAFQKEVAQRAFPHFNITACLLMADKSKTAITEGLNQKIRLPTKGDVRQDVQVLLTEEEATNEDVVIEVNLDDIIEDIRNGKYEFDEGHSFKSSLLYLSDVYQKGEYPNHPAEYSACKKCQFKANAEDKLVGFSSGFEHCMRSQLEWTDQDFDMDSVFDIWNFRTGSKLMAEKRMRLSELTIEDFKIKEEPDRLSASERRWVQVEKGLDNDLSPYVEKEGLKAEMSKWIFPYHFIDFETSAVALPFNKGRRPYEQVAFQFSHHICHADGRILHKSEYICAEPGVFPNFHFVRALKKSLDQDQGSVFRFASHENSILNAIAVQLVGSDEPDKQDLIDFIRSICTPTSNSKEIWTPTRPMVDLRDVVVDFYYHPLTKGSNSIKAVLPAVLNASPFLKNKYSAPVGDINLSSLNFDDHQIWFHLKNGMAVNPYKLLPALFDGWDDETLETTISGMVGIADGGAALTAYSKLQFVDMPDHERETIINGLLKYCELDTLAMVMIYEHLKELTH